jgi:hypothetical protein
MKVVAIRLVAMSNRQVKKHALVKVAANAFIVVQECRRR